MEVEMREIDESKPGFKLRTTMTGVSMNELYQYREHGHASKEAMKAFRHKPYSICNGRMVKDNDET